MSSWSGYRQPGNWGKLKARVLRRDRDTCQQCGAYRVAEVDHVVPVSQGGTHDLGNLRAICNRCHRAKTTTEAVAGRRASQARKKEARDQDDKHPGLL